MSRIIVAIDGPSGSGKSTIAKKVAQELGIEYLDTGAMYRGLALKVRDSKIDISDESSLSTLMDSTNISFNDGKILVDGKDVSGSIRTDEISQLASKISAIQIVRDYLVNMQREIGRSISLVADGRDTCTNVFKEADVKFFMTADVETRAKRRYEDLKVNNDKITYEEVLNQIKDRDYRDTNRDINPLCKAEDSIVIDNTNMSVDETLNKVIGKVKENGNS